MKILRPFLIALQFLTRFPVRLEGVPEGRDIGRSLLYYPLVGLLIGLLLAGLDRLLGGAGTMLAAAVLLAAWVLASGALHLDGLADSADAWVGGLGDRDRTLAIMKDPYCGPMGVVALLLVLLLKFAALEELVARGDWMILVLVPLLARTALPALFLTTPYVRPGGLGELLARHLPRRAAAITVLILLLGPPALLGWDAAVPLLAALAAFAVLRALMLRRLGGTTGDTAGAMVEIIETVVLVAVALT